MSSAAQRIPHVGDCAGTRCGYCGCCVHTTSTATCKTAAAPAGMYCPDSGCGCEGLS